MAVDCFTINPRLTGEGEEKKNKIYFIFFTTQINDPLPFFDFSIFILHLFMVIRIKSKLAKIKKEKNRKSRKKGRTGKKNAFF